MLTENPDSVLDRNGWQVCRKIGESFLAKDFYLAGGTGLALQLKHRRSFDLDFFRTEGNNKGLPGYLLSI
ncbi:nucleotidyl transferase AbiEii/AbiGii toxin family protein [Desulfotomaculum copahuensis]|uniref:nucleotidyl transferase AbiEii/AbiGii toxin family protein n=1 Tax=Desulfotomaculum copahuensis TaxID=1838280 RepID=UPI003D03BC7D